jgi:D-aminopeptidase
LIREEASCNVIGEASPDREASCNIIGEASPNMIREEASCNIIGSASPIMTQRSRAAIRSLFDAGNRNPVFADSRDNSSNKIHRSMN